MPKPIGPKEAQQRENFLRRLAALDKASQNKPKAQIIEEVKQSVALVNNATSRAVINVTSNKDRQSKWRDANPEVNRQRAREGMKKTRGQKVAQG